MRYRDMKCEDCPCQPACTPQVPARYYKDDFCISSKCLLEKFVDSEISKLSPKHTKKKLTIESSPEFDEFWKVYPRHDGKAAAIKAYYKVLYKNGSMVSFEDILDGAKKYSAWIKATGKQDYIAMASTWLNGERWNDELKSPSQPLNKTNHADIFNRAMEQVDRMTANDG